MTKLEIDEIFYTAYDGNFEAIQQHLDNGVSPNLQNEEGKTLLHVACDDGYTFLLELLLEYGADPNVEDNEGDTPIDYAIFKGYKEYVPILKEHGAAVRDRQSAIERSWQMINEAQQQVRAVQNLFSLIEKNKIDPARDTLTIKDKVLSVFKNRTGEKFGRNEIIDLVVRAYHGTPRDSVIPSDYCYNTINKDNQSFKLHLFESLGGGTYKCLGSNYVYSGAIYWKDKKVGQWEQGKYRLWEDPRKRNNTA
jgi:ankyrin repeat protein